MAQKSNPKPRLYAGAALRRFRHDAAMDQMEMARRIGISASYLSQIETDDRPLSTPVLSALCREFPEIQAILSAGAHDNKLAQLDAAFADPLFADALPQPDELARWSEAQPLFASHFLRLHSAYRQAGERLNMMDETLADQGQGDSTGRLPWEDVRDWFHISENYVDALDRAAEHLAAQHVKGINLAILSHLLADQHGIIVDYVASGSDGELVGLNKRAGMLRISSALPIESQTFFVAHQFAALQWHDIINDIAANAPLTSAAAKRLITIGLANYAASALLMPYSAFRNAARQMRHDIDRLSQVFSVSFEQACHRLSTLQRDGERGVPFFFCRVDMAGNITKRHSATRLQFARFGGACPLWIVHEAVAIPDRILVQLAETPDGQRYISMAKGLVKPSGSFTRSPRRYAVALGCEASQAHDFVYADGLDLSPQAHATPIGMSCRTCPRRDCDQRAFPPSDRAISVDPERRGIVPYRIG